MCLGHRVKRGMLIWFIAFPLPLLRQNRHSTSWAFPPQCVPSSLLVCSPELCIVLTEVLLFPFSMTQRSFSRLIIRGISGILMEFIPLLDSHAAGMLILLILSNAYVLVALKASSPGPRPASWRTLGACKKCDL